MQIRPLGGYVEDPLGADVVAEARRHPVTARFLDSEITLLRDALAAARLPVSRAQLELIAHVIASAMPRRDGEDHLVTVQGVTVDLFATRLAAVVALARAEGLLGDPALAAVGER